MVQPCCIERNKGPATHLAVRTSLTECPLLTSASRLNPLAGTAHPCPLQRKNALSTPPNVMPLHTNSPASASQGLSSLILGDSGRQHGTRPQPFLTAESCHSYFELIPGNYHDVALLLWLTSALDEFFKR